MPQPSSVTRISALPPLAIATSMRVAPASNAFSTSSLTAEAGRSTTSPAAMRLAAASSSCRITGRILGSWVFITPYLAVSGKAGKDSSVGRLNPVGPTDPNKANLIGMQQATRDALHILGSDGLDLAVPGIHVISRQADQLHPRQNRRDLAIAIETQRIFPGQVGLGIGQFLFGHAFGDKTVPDLPDQINRLGHLVIGAGHAALPCLAIDTIRQTGAHAIGQATLFADLFHQARGKTAAAKNVI